MGNAQRVIKCPSSIVIIKSTTQKLNLMAKYTKEQLMDPDIVVYCDNEQEYNKMCEIVGFNVASGYYGPYCYSPYDHTYCSSSSKNDIGAYVYKSILYMDGSPIRSLLPENAQRIIDMAYPDWQQRLAKKWGAKIALKQTIIVTEEEYQEMRKACTMEQAEVFDNEIFPIPKLKVGDWVTTTTEIKEYFCKFKKGETFQITHLHNGYAYYDPHNSVDLNRLRLATPEEIEKATLPKDGTPCWVKSSDYEPWILRYANGEGEFYDFQRKSGPISTWKHVRPFDPNDLPVNE
jgi:hypothetical protein